MRTIRGEGSNPNACGYVVMSYPPHNVRYFPWAMDMEDFLPSPGEERGVRRGGYERIKGRVGKKGAELREGGVRK
jgi:hypothetical protein